ncbi:MAG: hypothetical protein GY757_42765 [bacterium]|nr:hypothetical protein [bacterium]
MEPGTTVWDGSEFRSLLRKNFKENLFFKILETDDTGTAELTFTTSDTLSLYHITALAYSEDAFGKDETEIQVTRDLYLEETMPEFARKEDRFRAGVQVSNRTDETLDVNLKLKVEPPEGRLSVDHSAEHTAGHSGAGAAKDGLSLTVPSKGNKPVYYNFKAEGAGEAELYFYARTGKKNARDALLKKLPVFDNTITEKVVDFDSGNALIKHIDPTEKAKNGGRLNLNVTPSILKPAGHIARQLIVYPYLCMEQRASKVMPFLMLDDRLLSDLGITVDKTQVRKRIESYIKIIPEFMDSTGALSYYRGGRYSSDYLTIYVCWSLQLALERGIAVEAAAEVIKTLETYLSKASLTDSNLCFYQYLLSLNKRANTRKLKDLFKRRSHFSLMARGFLYRALKNQLGRKGRKKSKKMLGEFRQTLRVDGSFAYFAVGNSTYSRDWAFYSSRYATAFVTQAILEVEGTLEEAPRIMNWLINVPSYMWQTTQTNFWILAAMKQYSLTVEKNTAKKANITIAEQVEEKIFQSKKETWEVKKTFAKGAEPFRAEVKSDERVYLTTEMEYEVDGRQPESRGIRVRRNVYNKEGKIAEEFIKGEKYQVELLVEFDDELPYGVIDEPIAAGFEILREDFSTTRELEEFHTKNKKKYITPWWVRKEHAADRVIYYSYSFGEKKRFVYFIKALYSGTFTWMPTKVQGMYHPQYYGRTMIKKIKIKEAVGKEKIKTKKSKEIKERKKKKESKK